MPSSRCRPGRWRRRSPARTSPNRAAVVVRHPAVSRGWDRGPAAWRWWFPTSRPRVSLVRFDQVPARARRSRSAHPLAGQEVGAVSDRGRVRHLRARERRGRRRPRVRRGAGPARRPCANTKASARSAGPVRRPRRSGDVQRRQLLPGGRPRARRATGCVVHMRPDYTSIAIMRGGDVIFFRSKPEGDGRCASPIWCTRRRCTTRTACRDRASRACWSAAPAAPAATWKWPAAASRSASARRSRPIDPTRVALLPDRHQRHAGT